MRLFRRPARLDYATKIVAPEENKADHADPITPIPETPEPQVQLVQKCAACGEREATHPINVGWFYLGRLPFVSVCDACYAVAKQRETQHHMAQKKTAVEHPSVPVGRKRGVVAEQEG